MSHKKTPCSNIIFDCDGVIFNSNDLKIDAFRKTLSNYPEKLVDNFISFHVENAGISRYVKFRVFLEDFLNEKFDECEYMKLLKSFGDSCVSLYKKADVTPSSIGVLSELSENYPLYVASGSDEEELREVFLDRKIDIFFKDVFGSPKTKTECVQKAIKDIGSKNNVFMVGDAESDWRAACENNINFIFMSRFSENKKNMLKLSKTEGFVEIETLETLCEYITPV